LKAPQGRRNPQRDLRDPVTALLRSFWNRRGRDPGLRPGLPYRRPYGPAKGREAKGGQARWYKRVDWPVAV